MAETKKAEPRLQDYLRKYKGSNGKILVEWMRYNFKVMCVSKIAKENHELTSLLNKDGRSLALVLKEMPEDVPRTIGVFKCESNQLEFNTKVTCIDSKFYLVTLKPSNPLYQANNVVSLSVPE